MSLVLQKQNGHADERLQIIKLLLEHGFRYHSTDNSKLYTLERIIWRAHNLSEHPYDDDDLFSSDPNDTPDVINIKKALATIIIETLKIKKQDILSSSALSEANKKLCLNVVTNLHKTKFIPQMKTSQQIDMLRSGLPTHKNPFFAQGTRDTIMEYATDKPYLSKEQRSMLMEDMLYGGKRRDTKRHAPYKKQSTVAKTRHNKAKHGHSK
jgi:hypothetical protein